MKKAKFQSVRLKRFGPVSVAAYLSQLHTIKMAMLLSPPVCPHLEEPLEESGLVIGCKLTCTKHLWSWDLETLELQDEAELPLKTYDVKVEDDNIMVYVTEQLEYAFDEDDDIDEATFFEDDDDDDDEW